MSASVAGAFSESGGCMCIGPLATPHKGIYICLHIHRGRLSRVSALYEDYDYDYDLLLRITNYIRIENYVLCITHYVSCMTSYRLYIRYDWLLRSMFNMYGRERPRKLGRHVYGSLCSLLLKSGSLLPARIELRMASMLRSVWSFVWGFVWSDILIHTIQLNHITLHD